MTGIGHAFDRDTHSQLREFATDEFDDLYLYADDWNERHCPHQNESVLDRVISGKIDAMEFFTVGNIQMLVGDPVSGRSDPCMTEPVGSDVTVPFWGEVA